MTLSTHVPIWVLEIDHFGHIIGGTKYEGRGIIPTYPSNELFVLIVYLNDVLVGGPELED